MTDPDCRGAAEAQYPMRVVTRMTGLSAATIRAWERRYGAVEPHRSEGNTRLFTPDDVRRLTLLRELTERGHAIREAATLDDRALESTLAELDAKSSTKFESGEVSAQEHLGGLVEAYLGAIARFDARRAQGILRRSAALLHARDFVFEIALPVIQEVGRRWSHAELGVAQEHLVTVQLEGVLSSLLQLMPPDPGLPGVVVATPSNERHSFGGLVGALIAVSRGVEPIYLGADLPFAEIARAAEMSRSRLILLAVVRDLEAHEREPLARGLRSLDEEAEVWVGCPEGHDLPSLVPHLRYFHDFESLDLALTHHATTRAARRR